MVTTARRYIEIEVTNAAALRALQGIERSSAKAEKSLQGLQAAALQLRQSFLLWRTAAIGLIGTTGLGGLNDAAVDLRARLTGAVEGTDAVDAAFDDLQAIALKTGVGIDSIGTSFVKLATTLDGVPYEDVVKGLDLVSTGLATTGASTQAANAVMLQLGQGLGSVAVQGDEFRSIYENFPQLLKAWQQAMGLTDKALKDISADADFTSESFYENIDAIEANLIAMTGLEKPVITLSRAFSNLRSAVIELFFRMSGEGDTAFTRLAQTINSIARNLNDFQGVLVGTLEFLEATIDVVFELGKAFVDLGGDVLGSVAEVFGLVVSEVTQTETEIEDWGDFVGYMFAVTLPVAIKSFAEAFALVPETIRGILAVAANEIAGFAERAGILFNLAAAEVRQGIGALRMLITGSAEMYESAREEIERLNQAYEDSEVETEDLNEVIWENIEALFEQSIQNVKTYKTKLEDARITRQQVAAGTERAVALRNESAAVNRLSDEYANAKKSAGSFLEALQGIQSELTEASQGPESQYDTTLQLSGIYNGLDLMRDAVRSGDLEQVQEVQQQLQQMFEQVDVADLDLNDKFQLQGAVELATRLAKQIDAASGDVTKVAQELKEQATIDEQAVDAEGIKQGIIRGVDAAREEVTQQPIVLDFIANVTNSAEGEVAEAGRKQ